MGNLSTLKSVQKLQTALHAKAKAEAGYRFYALYDKISREGILAHAYAQCRSYKGAPGARWSRLRGHRDVWGATVARRTGACAQAGGLPAGPYQKSVYTEGQRQTRPLGISTLRDRVCMTAAMLVLEPIFVASGKVQERRMRTKSETFLRDPEGSTPSR